MSSEALELSLLAVFALALSLLHVWHAKCSARRKMDAEDAARLDAVRQAAVEQLRAEHRLWSVAPASHGLAHPLQHSTQGPDTLIVGSVPSST